MWWAYGRAGRQAYRQVGGHVGGEGVWGGGSMLGVGVIYGLEILGYHFKSTSGDPYYLQKKCCIHVK